MKPAPPFDCADCGHRIGKMRTHWIMPGDKVICIRCHETRYARTRIDEHLAHGTRAGIASRPGLLTTTPDQEKHHALPDPRRPL
jgi:hypothetical protein